ncbi:MAG: SPOR domain-containing protein, partial [Treponema sp.]|nr:SPOR domain-containing protein [Treponema sp.]
MKKSFKFFLSIFILAILVVGAGFADGYHVCVASYKKLDNAESMIKKLEKQSVAALVSENKVKNQSFYRVLLSKEFKKIQDARKYRDEVKNYSFAKELGLKDFWVCESEKIVLRNQLVKITTDLPQPAKVAPAPAPKKVVEEKPVPKAKPAPVPVPVPAPLPIPEEPEVKTIAPVEDAKSVAPLPIIVPIPQPEIPLLVEEESEIPEEPEEPEEVPEPEDVIEPEAPAEELPVIVVEEPKTLGANEKAVLSEKNPYSVIVR